MRYASIRSLDVSNGEGTGISLFVQGCHKHCKNCFNPETWDFNSGKEWNSKSIDKLNTLLKRPYIKRFTILGGEPLALENIEEVLLIISFARAAREDIKIWLYTGNILDDSDFRPINERAFVDIKDEYLFEVINNCDVIIDGPYIDELKDIRLKFRGSSNQRIIDVKASQKEGKIVLWGENN